MEVWWWTEEAGRARRSERARVMRWERGLRGEGGGGERGGNKGADAGAGLGQCNVGVHARELVDAGVKREEALLARDRCRGGVGGGVVMGELGEGGTRPCVSSP
jgi:hypothetical protein